MKKTLLLTRPQSASDRAAAILAQRDFGTIIEPLLILTPTNTPRPDGDFQAVFITSANAPDTLTDIHASIDGLLNLPCYCVGASTGAAARALGFTDIQCGDSDSAGLAKLALQNMGDKTKPLLHIAGDQSDAKLAGALSAQGFTLIPWIVYLATARDDFSPALCAAITRGDIESIPVFSPRSARILVSLIEKNHLTQACNRINAVGLSQAVADVLQNLPWRRLVIAAKPTEEEMFVCLESPMTEDKAPVAPASPVSANPAACTRKRSCVPLLLCGFILAACAGGYALLHCPLFQTLLPAPASSSDLATVEQRLDNLETKINSLTEIAPPAARPNDNAALADTVKNLQAQITELQNQKNTGPNNQQQMAATLAFWELRDAAATGRDFLPALATLTKAAPDDEAVKTQNAKIETLTNTPPTCAQLRITLAKEETKTDAAPNMDSPEWLERLKKTMRPLISIHPLHNAQFTTIEQALDANDSAAALQAFAGLSEETQTTLSAWHTQLQNRATLDDAIHTLSAHFASPTGDKQ